MRLWLSAVLKLGACIFVLVAGPYCVSFLFADSCNFKEANFLDCLYPMPATGCAQPKGEVSETTCLTPAKYADVKAEGNWECIGSGKIRKDCYLATSQALCYEVQVCTWDEV